MVSVVVVVLSILSATIFILFRANIRSQTAVDQRMRARYAAESGVSLALHYMALETIQPAQSIPYYLPGDSLGWIDVFADGDMALVVIDQMDGGFGGSFNSTVEIRSRGRSGEEEVDVVVRVSPDTPSRYALITDRGIGQGFLSDGLVLEGPVHSNGTVEFSSMSPDSTGDPMIPEVSTTGQGGFYFSDIGYSDDPHPQGSRIWVRPYTRHRSGSPSWNTHSGAVDFQ